MGESGKKSSKSTAVVHSRLVGAGARLLSERKKGPFPIVLKNVYLFKYQSSIQLGPEEMRSELLKRPHILICSAEFLSSEEVDPGHLLQLTSVVIDFWYIHTDGCTRCVIDSLLKCENRENG